MPADNRLCIVIPFYSVISIEKRQWRCVTVAMGLRVVSFRFCYCIRHRRIGSFFFVQATAENTRSDAVDDRKRWKRGSRGMAIDSRHFHLQIIIFFSCIISRAEM